MLKSLPVSAIAALLCLQAGVVRAYQMMPPPMPDLDRYGNPIVLGPILDVYHPARVEIPPAELPAVDAADPAADVESEEPETTETTTEDDK